VLLPPWISFGELVLWLVVAWGGSLLLHSFVSFPWYLLPALAVASYSCVKALRDDDGETEDDAEVDDWGPS
jgi:hypothetical protein